MPILGFGYTDRSVVSERSFYGFDPRQPPGFGEARDQFPSAADSVSSVFLTVDGVRVAVIPSVFARLLVTVSVPEVHAFKPVTITRLPLSGLNNLPRIVDTTPTLVCTAVDAFDTYDELWLWVTNSSLLSGTVTLTFRLGIATVVKKLNVPSTGRFCICPGIAYGDGVEISIASDIGCDQIMVDGYINRLGH